MRRKVTDATLTKSFGAIRAKNPLAISHDVIRLVAKRVSRSFVATARRLNKLGLVNTKTSRSR